MLSFSASRKNTESQKILFNEVCKALERRWVEIKGNFRKSLPEAHFLVFIPKSLLLLVLKVGQLLNLNILGASALVVQAPSDNFWVLLSKANFNNLVSGKDTFRPLLLTDITGLRL